MAALCELITEIMKTILSICLILFVNVVFSHSNWTDYIETEQARQDSIEKEGKIKMCVEKLYLKDIVAVNVECESSIKRSSYELEKCVLLMTNKIKNKRKNGYFREICTKGE